MQITLKRAELEHAKNPDGLSITVEGFKGDDSAAPAVQVFIEVYEGTLRVHTWDGTSQDPKTITIDPA